MCPSTRFQRLVSVRVIAIREYPTPRTCSLKSSYVYHLWLQWHTNILKRRMPILQSDMRILNPYLGSSRFRERFSDTWRPLYLHGWNLIPTWISNHMPIKVWDENTSVNFCLLQLRECNLIRCNAIHTQIAGCAVQFTLDKFMVKNKKCNDFFKYCPPPPPPPPPPPHTHNHTGTHIWGDPRWVIPEADWIVLASRQP